MINHNSVCIFGIFLVNNICFYITLSMVTLRCIKKNYIIINLVIKHIYIYIYITLYIIIFILGYKECDYEISFINMSLPLIHIDSNVY